MKSISSCIPMFQDYQKGRSLAHQTRLRSLYYLNRFATWSEDMDIREVTMETFFSYKEFLMSLDGMKKGEKIKPITVEHHLAVLRDFFTYLYRIDLLLSNPAEDLTVNLRIGKDQRPIFSAEEMSTFLDCIKVNGPVGQRDRALFELIYSSGLRSDEAAGLLVKQINLKERTCLVQGKGRKDRYVPFSKTAGRFLKKYLETGRKSLAREQKDKENRRYAFLSSAGKISWKVMRTRFNHYLELAGVEKKGRTIHCIRHSTATHLLENGASVRYVQELLGHRSLKTTQIYTRPTEENIKGVYRTYHPRENEYYMEIEKDYLVALAELKAEIIETKETYRRKKCKMIVENSST